MDQIRKRDRSVVAFEPSKIANAIRRAMEAVGEGSQESADNLTREVVTRLSERFDNRIPNVEDVQDQVEEVLIERGLPQTAKAYILYRARRAEIRHTKDFIGVRDELKLTVNAVNVLKRRYLLKNKDGQVVETPDQMFRRVARAAASAESLYDPEADISGLEEEYYNMMVSLEFLPNSPTLMNAGTGVGQLSACFVLPIPDCIPGIFDAVKDMALVHKSGGGTGFSFSRLRPKGDIVQSTMGIASGPISFMRILDVTTEIIRQGGRRRGANMGILKCDHPDILEFITCKGNEGFLTNFNLSVGITDEFMQALEGDGVYSLRNPRDGEVVGSLHARDVFNLIVTQAWRTGDPGLVFIDTINRYNPTPRLGEIESTNPCGEQPLLPWESCNLGSVNLKAMVEDGKFNREKFTATIHKSIHFLDNIIDINRWPLEESEAITKGNRKIGLGVMGLADALIMMGLAYDSEEGLEAAEGIAALLEEEAHKASMALADRRGNFPNYEGSIWDDRGIPMRNATCTTIAPTGTISIIAGCSSGIEPLFAVCFVRNVIEGTQLMEINPVFEQMARAGGFFSNQLLMDIARSGTLSPLGIVPEDVSRLFATAFDIKPEWHVRMQAVFQKHCDNAVSKTINFPSDASIEDIEESYRLAYRLGCKGITVYRYGSRREQVLYLGSNSLMRLLEKPEYTMADSEYAGGCPTPLCFF
ncbi:MAG: ribonucleoside-diphosphate reductase, adenosylcobalamin-dependent [Candidatus Solincola sediminis]|uniref:Vitamin B12-dependent ribonucleotide reductase n=1 Tax=Candidatus Solincola sediminis TaxID=1797199 RepID=A0A1F2WHG1_9ACTN|nr:MAG: ribonucleoside-diphosphate reductase, adenosylcobalamin-dependent [Candidatus Solincola sediminis]